MSQNCQLFFDAIFMTKDFPMLLGHMLPSVLALSTRAVSRPKPQRQYHFLHPAILVEYRDIEKSRFEPCHHFRAFPATIRFSSGLMFGVVFSLDRMDYQ